MNSPVLTEIESSVANLISSLRSNIYAAVLVFIAIYAVTLGWATLELLLEIFPNS